MYHDNDMHKSRAVFLTFRGNLKVLM